MASEQTRPFEIVDGSIARSDAGERIGFLGPLHRLPGTDRLARWHPAGHAAAAAGLGRLVRETSRFVGNELRGASGVRAYTLRHGGRTVLLRHGGVDVWTFNELFLLRLYEPPTAVRRLLGAIERPVVLDLGANIGMFGLDALERYPGAFITSYEPDPVSAQIHHELIERNRGSFAGWQLVEACAGPREGSVTFLPGQQTESRIVDEPQAGTVSVPMHDVMPTFARTDLVKLDIEGGEWEMLADARFSQARVVVLEYHPPGCPETDTHATARRLLEGHGYTLIPLFEHPDGVGMLWGYRDGTA